MTNLEQLKLMANSIISFSTVPAVDFTKTNLDIHTDFGHITFTYADNILLRPADELAVYNLKNLNKESK